MKRDVHVALAGACATTRACSEDASLRTGRQLESIRVLRMLRFERVILLIQPDVTDVSAPESCGALMKRLLAWALMKTIHQEVLQ